MPPNPSLNALRVCIVTTGFPRWSGDTRAPFVYNAALSLVKLGLQVKVIAMHNPGAKTYEIMDGIEVYRPRYLPERWEILQKESGGIPLAWKVNPIGRLALLPFIVVHAWTILRRSKDVDVIHANWTLSGAAALLSKWFHRKPILVTVQGSDIFQVPKLPFGGIATRFFLAKVDRVIALSNSLFQELRRLGISSSKICVIPNGVDINLFSCGKGPREPLVVYVGSLIERKGVHYLVSAMKQLVDLWPEGKLVIIGDGSSRDQLIEMVRALQLENHIQFIGVQPQEEINLWLRKASVFVLPSIEEGLGVVLLEALASGTPCVGSNVGGIPDVVTSQVGKLAPPADAGALAQAIWDVVKDKNRWEEMSNQARQRAEKVYSWDNIAHQIVNEYVYFSRQRS